MSVPYHDVLASIALRISALTGTLGPALETTFTTRPLTTTQFQSTVFPFTAVKYAVISAEEKLAHAIANTANHPWRRSLGGAQTVPMANESLIPQFSVTADPIIGVYGSVFDSSDLSACTEKPLAVIRRRVRNAASFPTGSSIYNYHVDSNRIYHTRTAVVMDVCVYDRADQLATLTANGSILLPDVLEEAYICGAVAVLVRDDEFGGQASTYSAYFANTLDMISKGFTAVPSKPKLAA